MILSPHQDLKNMVIISMEFLIEYKTKIISSINIGNNISITGANLSYGVIGYYTNIILLFKISNKKQSNIISTIESV